MCVTVGRGDMSRFTEGSWQGSFTVNNERAVRTLKPSSEQENALREFLQGHNLLVNFPTLVFQRLPNATDALPRILQSSRQF